MLLIRSQKGLSILCDYGAFLVLLRVRKKNRWPPGLLSAFDTDFADPLLKEVIDLET